MYDYLISMFIDDELNLDDKIEFVETVHADVAFKSDTIDLLEQEKLLRADVVTRVPDVGGGHPAVRRFPMARTVGGVVAGLVAAMLVLFFSFPATEPVLHSTQYRFVLYRPDVTQAQIAGTFTEWKTMPMDRLGDSGYWEIVLDIPPGEHRFSYILEGERRIADPTIMTRERDDFGGENSVLEVNA